MPYSKERNCGAFPGKDWPTKEWCIRNRCNSRCKGCPVFNKLPADERRDKSIYEEEWQNH